jgi:NAD(P)H-hydrate epimerase
MLKLVTSETMRQIDREAIDGRGIPSDELMENAGRGIAEAILRNHFPSPTGARAAVFCGKGNNGGDGYVVARYLSQAGVEVTVYFLGPLEKLSKDARLNFDRVAGMGLELNEISAVNDLPDQLECDLIIDAIFGTGFEGAPRGLSGEIIEYINAQDFAIASVDMPSGLNADNGVYEGAVVAADNTYTLALPKYGLFISPGREVAGEVEVIPIGIPDDVVASFDLKISLTGSRYVSGLMPMRPPDAHKGIFGRVLLVAGSTGLTGAAAMAGDSALRTGNGLVKVACPRSVQPVLATKLTEVMTYPLPDVAKKGALAVRALGEIRELIKEHDAIVLGPGIGRHHETFELVRRLVAKIDKPTIIDADGLNALAEHTDILKDCSAPLVLTPHPGEFKRLSGIDVPRESEIQERAKIAMQFASDHGVVLVLKGSPTLIASPDGECYLNPTGNNGMASGGSGDILSGIIGSLLGQHVPAFDAAVAAVFIHGLAGDMAAEVKTPRAMIAGDMISFLPEVFQVLE